MSLAAMAWVVGIAALLVVEVVQLARKRELLSQVVWRLSGRYPLIPFATGVLCGHFFWQSAALYVAQAVESAGK